jgi:hypothetical protein
VQEWAKQAEFRAVKQGDHWVLNNGSLKIEVHSVGKEVTLYALPSSVNAVHEPETLAHTTFPVSKFDADIVSIFAKRVAKKEEDLLGPMKTSNW